MNWVVADDAGRGMACSCRRARRFVSEPVLVPSAACASPSMTLEAYTLIELITVTAVRRVEPGAARGNGCLPPAGCHPRTRVGACLVVRLQGGGGGVGAGRTDGRRRVVAAREVRTAGWG